MGNIDKRSITLSTELAAAVDDAVTAGEYASASEVIRDALRLWKERRDLFGYTLEELRVKWGRRRQSQTGGTDNERPS